MGGGEGVSGGFLSFFSSFRVVIISILISKTKKETIEPCFSTLVTKNMSEELALKGAFRRARISTEFFANVALHTIYFGRFS